MIKKVRIAVDHGNRNMKTCSQVFTTGLTIQDKKPARGEKFLFYEGKYSYFPKQRIPFPHMAPSEPSALNMRIRQSAMSHE